MDIDRLDAAITTVEDWLLEDFDGHWEGRLSSSALATAVALFAMERIDPVGFDSAINRGIRWLQSSVNHDGGWGDSPESPSNLSTTLLVWSAVAARDPDLADRAAAWVADAVGSLEAKDIVDAVLETYGNDQTFSAPILFMCALAGRLGPSPFQYVPQLPFEIAVLPQALFRFVNLPVVSYAIPALAAIGMGRYSAAGRKGFRHLLRPAVLSVLDRMQPENGGFLEAAPLTAFVALGLEAAGCQEHRVVRRALSFLQDSQRDDGSWPIDTNLATWVSTLAINALRPSRSGQSESWRLSDDQRQRLGSWLLDQQLRAKHPFTGAAPGGWAWTDRPGAVPDADDTAGALLALDSLEIGDAMPAVEAGCRWLMTLQNRDGGIPTFCRGWGRLPFDASCPDITAHALRAWACWRDAVSPGLATEIGRAMARARTFLEISRRHDGSWEPLWFGNQNRADRGNPVYGTARVIDGLAAVGDQELYQSSLKALARWQNDDGGWGQSSAGGSTIEETAVALVALAGDGDRDQLLGGAQWLIGQLEDHPAPEPIGLYFASLWYSEKMYPLVFSLAALRALRCRFNGES